MGGLSCSIHSYVLSEHQRNGRSRGTTSGNTEVRYFTKQPLMLLYHCCPTFLGLADKQGKSDPTVGGRGFCSPLYQ
jgi:hypothetical protein